MVRDIDDKKLIFYGETAPITGVQDYITAQRYLNLWIVNMLAKLGDGFEIIESRIGEIRDQTSEYDIVTKLYAKLTVLPKETPL